MSGLPFELMLSLRYLRPKRTFLSIITLISVPGVTLGVAALTVNAGDEPKTIAFSTGASGPVGFATVNGNVTGGQGGPIVTVSNAEEFVSAVTASGPAIVRVTGAIMVGSALPTPTFTSDGKKHTHSGKGSVRLASNKTIIGAGTNATYIGNIDLGGVSNVIVQNLFFTNPNGVGGGDGITINSNIATGNLSHHLWIDHCTFNDCKDGEVDIGRGSDYVTVSWCRFYYQNQKAHNFCNLVGASVGNTEDIGREHITFHHNWWDAGCRERMPRVRYGRVHVFNNYINCPGNAYCVGAGYESQLLVENNYYENIKLPYLHMNEIHADSSTNHGLINAVGNITINCKRVSNYTDTVFAPPYPYTLETPAAAKTNVMAGAGAGRAVLFP